MKTPITNRCSIRYPVKNVLRAVLIGLGVLNCAAQLSAQSGAYSLNGGSASLAGITNSTSTTDQSGIYVYNSGTLTVGTVNIVTSGNASSANNSCQYDVNAGILAGSSSTRGTILITGSSNSIVTTGSDRPAGIRYQFPNLL